MNTISTKLIIESVWVALFFFLFSAGVAFADDCAAAKIAIVAGPWENSDGKTSYTVQAQDSAGVACPVGETLRLSFASSGAGTFTGQTGSPVQAWISKSSANRNFYYQYAVGATDVLTIKAGYGPADSWSVLWQTSHDTSTSPPPKDGDESSDDDDSGDTTDTTTATSGGQKGTPMTNSSNTHAKVDSETLARARMFQNDPLKLVISHPKQASVGQPVQFAAMPSGLEARELLTMRYVWSFGDTGTSSDRTPAHAYANPGTYVVVGMAHRSGHEIAIRSEVTILPLEITLTRSAGGDLVVHNTASHEIEISGLTLSDGAHRFTVPDYTYLLPKASLTLPVALTGFTPDSPEAFVYNRSGKMLSQYPALAQNLAQSTEAQLAEEQKEEKQQTLAPIKAADTRKPTAAPLSPPPAETKTKNAVSAASLTKAAVVRNDTTNTTDEMTKQTDTTPYEGQLAALSTYDQSGADDTARIPSSSRWTVPFTFVGVLLIGILALYIHKIV